jgi:hypothetical protein
MYTWSIRYYFIGLIPRFYFISKLEIFNNMITFLSHRLLDEINKMILSQLGKNARMSSLQIAHTLKEMGYDITDRSVRHRLERLEKSAM